MKTAIIYGIHAVAAALEKKGQVQGLLLEQRRRPNARLAALIEQARQAQVSLGYVSIEELDGLAEGGRHQGVVARVVTVEQPTDLEGFVEALDHPPFLLVLDGVTDPHNLGACLRSADAAGVDAVIVPKDNAVGITPVVRKVACGAAETVPFFQVTNLARTLRFLQEQGVWMMGAAGEAESTIYSVDFTGPLALVMGAEEKGLRRLTREHCDVLIKIPMAGQVESLNVSVATGVCLFEAVRQRSARR